MTRNQYWTLFGGACFVALLLLFQLVTSRNAQFAQARIMAAQQVISEGRNCDLRTRQLATRIYQLAQQTQDQGLKDLLARQQIVSNVPPAAPAGAPAAAAPMDR